ncbi:hypothetical protein GRJ2_002312100 [Grus japonensis]|uniref:Uncharacterized protein n=1 Tax=Grus japonensis TaxID=30415 RepID=A0ABC9XM40_GRUJA
MATGGKMRRRDQPACMDGDSRMGKVTAAIGTWGKESKRRLLVVKSWSGVLGTRWVRAAPSDPVTAAALMGVRPCALLTCLHGEMENQSCSILEPLRFCCPVGQAVLQQLV